MCSFSRVVSVLTVVAALEPVCAGVAALLAAVKCFSTLPFPKICSLQLGRSIPVLPSCIFGHVFCYRAEGAGVAGEELRRQA